MPTYTYQCSSCNHTFDKNLKMAEMNQPISEPCPHCNKEDSITKLIVGKPMLIDPVRLGRGKDGGFQEVLQKIHHSTPKSNLHLKF